VRSRQVSARRRVTRWSLLAAAALLIGAGGIATATTLSQVPENNTGPQFGEFRPGAGPPAGAAPVHPATLGAPAPGAPAPGVPSPAWGGCNWNLSGNWVSSGQENVPTYFTYDGTVSVQQWGPWLQATETQSGGQTQYYGRCNGNSVRFDVYANGQFIGYQGGTFQASSRFGSRADFSWSTWAPDFASGVEHWRRGGPFY
jgi:hypothetical protein